MYEIKTTPTTNDAKTNNAEYTIVLKVTVKDLLYFFYYKYSN